MLFTSYSRRATEDVFPDEPMRVLLVPDEPMRVLLVADEVEWSPAARGSGPVFSTPVRPSSTLLSPAAMLYAEADRCGDRRFSRHAAVHDRAFSPFIINGGHKEGSEAGSHQSSHQQKQNARLLADTILDPSEDSDVSSGGIAARHFCSHSLEVEVAEESLTIGSRPPGPLTADPVAVWRRELWDRTEPECLTYLQSRPVRQVPAAVAAGNGKAAVSEQDWLRTVQESGRCVQSSMKAFKRYAGHGTKPKETVTHRSQLKGSTS
jgi:hypothetical protein